MMLGIWEILIIAGFLVAGVIVFGIVVVVVVIAMAKRNSKSNADSNDKATFSPKR